MRTHKAARSSSARTAAIAMIQQGREEELLLGRWAAADSARTMDDPDWDASMDRFEIDAVSASSRHNA